MTMSAYSNVIVDVMLGWLKGIANWVLRLFNLAGSVSTSPLLWLSRNWLKLLIFFLVLGIVLDRLIWLIRWRPYWVWFRRERVIVNDDKFFSSVDMDKASDWEGDLEDNWDEHDYVVASTVVKRRGDNRARGAVVKGGKRPAGGRGAASTGERVRDTRVERHVDRTGKPSVRRGDAARAQNGRGRGEGAARDDARWRRSEATSSVAPENMFAVDLNKPDVSDFYEDEVFNVTNLPVSDEFSADKAE